MLAGAFEVIKALKPKSELEKIENEWKKDHPKLVKAVLSGDIDIYNSILAKYKSQL